MDCIKKLYFVGCDPCGRPNLRKQHDKQHAKSYVEIVFKPIQAGGPQESYPTFIQKI